MERLHGLIAGIGGDLYFRADAHQRFRERLGNHELIPGVENPGVVQRDIEGGHGQCGCARKRDWAGLGDVFRSARAVDGEGDGVAEFEFPLHSKQRGSAAAAAGAANRGKSQLFDCARDVFTVETAAHHNGDAEAAPHPGGGEDGAMPERIDDTFFVRCIGRCGRFLPRDGVPQSASDERNGDVGGPADEREKKTLAKGETLFAFRYALFARGGVVGPPTSTRGFIRVSLWRASVGWHAGIVVGGRWLIVISRCSSGRRIANDERPKTNDELRVQVAGDPLFDAAAAFVGDIEADAEGFVGLFPGDVAAHPDTRQGQQRE